MKPQGPWSGKRRPTGPAPPWQRREAKWEPPRAPSKPTEVMELEGEIFQAIQDRQPESIRGALNTLQQRGMFFPPGDWAEFAARTASMKDPSMLSMLWDGVRSSLDRFGFYELRSFASAAVATGNIEVLGDVFKAATSRNVLFMPDQWALLSDAAAETGNAEVLTKLWESTGSSRGHFGFQELGRFAAAAVATRNSQVLSDVMEAIYKVGFLPPPQWSSLLDVAFHHPNSDVAFCLWNASASSRGKFWAATFAQFASLAAAVKEPSLLEHIFDAWTPSADTLGCEYPET